MPFVMLIRDLSARVMLLSSFHSSPTVSVCLKSPARAGTCPDPQNSSCPTQEGFPEPHWAVPSAVHHPPLPGPGGCSRTAWPRGAHGDTDAGVCGSAEAALAQRWVTLAQGWVTLAWVM